MVKNIKARTWIDGSKSVRVIDHFDPRIAIKFKWSYLKEFIDMKLYKIIVLNRNRFWPIYSTFGWSVLERFGKGFFGFGMIGVPYKALVYGMVSIFKATILLL